MVIVTLSLLGCFKAQEQQRLRRVWEMQDHEAAYVVGRDALIRGDLAGARAAGEDLAAPDPVPGLPEAALADLEAVRAGGRSLAAAPDLATAAQRLVEVTAECASCHHAMGVEAASPMTEEPTERLWASLVFESEADWQEAAAALGAPTLTGAQGWTARRAAVAGTLAR